MIEIAKTARGKARPAGPEEIAKEQLFISYLLVDSGFALMSDSDQIFRPNIDDWGYTNPNLHRRIVQDAEIPPGSNYTMVHYDEEGNPYKQHIDAIGVWDGVNSYRTTRTFTHDEESTTCEIP